MAAVRPKPEAGQWLSPQRKPGVSFWLLIFSKYGTPMPSFQHDDVEIAYLDEGEGDPIMLVHGFASTKNVNWVYPTWVSELRKNGCRVIALDNRGHGDSASSTTPRNIPFRSWQVMSWP